MATITVRNISPEILSSLKDSARRHRKSMEQEVRDLLEARYRNRRAVTQLIESSWPDKRSVDGEAIEKWVKASREWNPTS